ncbi:MAG: bifunctional GNAT family N-acetyltransferase/ATP-binding protein [Egibacteraceae bacterium]
MFNVRDYLPSDLTSAVRLLESVQDRADTPRLDPSRFIAEMTNGGFAVVAVVQEEAIGKEAVGEEVVGLVTAHAASTEAWIYGIAIATPWRHQGIGSALLDRLEQRLLHGGVRRISALLAPGQVGQAALANRGFAATEGLVLHEKTEPLAPRSFEVVEHWGGMLLPEGLWEQAAGMEREKQVIESRIVDPLASPELAERIGLRPPSAVLLFGPPGTGKTTFAQAVASTLRWPFVELLPSKLAAAEGTLASELRRAFVELAELEHVVLFIDEFDELVPAREGRPASAGVVNELLKSIPEFRSRPGRLLVCATNFVDTIDPAVLRPGRFDLLIGIGPPDKAARAALWGRQLEQMDVADDADPATLADVSAGFTAGDIDLAAQRAAVTAFQRARGGQDRARIEVPDLTTSIAATKPSISAWMRERFATQLEEYSRV